MKLKQESNGNGSTLLLSDQFARYPAYGADRQTCGADQRGPDHQKEWKEEGMDCGALGRTHSFRLEISMAFGSIFRALRRLLAIKLPCRRLLRREAAALHAINAYLAAATDPQQNGRPSVAALLEQVPSLGPIGTDEIQGHGCPPGRKDDWCRTVEGRPTTPPDAAIQSMVAAMPPLSAAILALRVHHDMSVADIAERFAIPRWKIRMHLRCVVRVIAETSMPKGPDGPG